MRNLEKYLLEGIPFPFSRIYDLAARKNPLTRRLYDLVAGKVANNHISGRILDVGTGPGYLPIAIAKLIKRVEVIGVDISRDMIRIARSRAEEEGLTRRVRFEVADAREMPFEDASFDLVLITASFHHWKKPIEVLNEIHRVLKTSSEAWIYDLRRGATKSDLSSIKDKYGRMTGSLIYHIITIHSGMTREEFKEILHSS